MSDGSALSKRIEEMVDVLDSQAKSLREMSEKTVADATGTDSYALAMSVRALANLSSAMAFALPMLDYLVQRDRERG